MSGVCGRKGESGKSSHTKATHGSHGKIRCAVFSLIEYLGERLGRLQLNFVIQRAAVRGDSRPIDQCRAVPRHPFWRIDHGVQCQGVFTALRY